MTRLRRAFVAVLVLGVMLLALWRVRGPGEADDGPADARPEARARRTGPAKDGPRRRLGPRPEGTEPLEEMGYLPADVETELRQYYFPACEVRGVSQSPDAILFIGGSSGEGLAEAGPVVLHSGRLWLPHILPEGEGVLAVEGYGPVRLQWDDKGCSPSPLVLGPPAATLSGVVLSAEGQPAGKVFVEGCGARALTDADGAYAMELLPGDCAVRAFRQDGYFLARSAPEALRVRDGDELVRDLRLPSARRGGVGMRIKPEEEGFRVWSVMEGTPAEAAGLQGGDLVLAVDGESVAQVGSEGFVERVTGDEGTPVTLLVRDEEGQEREVTLLRVAMGE